MDNRNQCRSEESQAKISEVLMREWDPLRVRDVPQAGDT
jgi:hypothetical protein